MPNNFINAEAMDLNRLLSLKELYHVPLFQRQYVWGQGPIERLFEDIASIDLDETSETHFIGAIFLSDKKPGGAGTAREFWLIDGQQRLTTLYLALLHIATQAQKHQDLLLANKIDPYLFERLPDNTRQPRLIPTLMDSTQFKDLLTAYASPTPVRLPPAGGLPEDAMSRAALVIHRAVSLEIAPERKYDPAKAEALFRRILERLVVVVISLRKEDEPSQIFHTLNALGVKLETLDLARNDIFARVDDDDPEHTKAKALYDLNWLPFIKRFDNTGDHINDYFFPYALTFKPTAKASKLIISLRELWKEQLHSQQPEQIINHLARHAGPYLALTKRETNELSGLNLPDAAELQFRRFRRMRKAFPSSTYPFLFNLHRAWSSGKLSDEWHIRNLQLLESFLVRRFFAGQEPTGLHAVFKGLWATTEGDPTAFVNFFKNNPTNSFIPDAKFAEDIASRRLYGRSLAKYVIMEYERFVADDTLSDDVETTEDVTIDHLLPQSLTATWNVAKDEHSELCHTWANLVPLTQPLNASKGNAPWTEIQAMLSNSMFASTRLVAREPQWGIEAIRARAVVLSKWAVTRWPHPA